MLILALLLLVALSSLLGRAVPIIPLPFVQIGLGLVVGFVGGLDLSLDPAVFLLIFVPPLLFLDGWRTPIDETRREGGAILRMAFGLVVFTVLGVGLLVHLAVPAVPQSVSFALAAIVAPTDPVAVATFSGGGGFPRRIRRILDGEALLNDASGLSCLKVAVAATVTGGFSLGAAAGVFAWTALGGVIVGIAVAMLAVRARDLLAGKRADEDAGASVLVAMLMPFAAYIAADHLDCSGVLAAASAGLTMNATRAAWRGGAAIRVRSRAVWDMLAFTFNGAIFVLLGAQLPGIVAHADRAAAEAGLGGAVFLPILVVGITAALLASRFFWVWLSLRLWTGGDHSPVAGTERRTIAAVSVAGAKGTVTLAAALSLPVRTASGAAFPARDLVIAVAAGVILLSMLMAAIAVPLLLRGLRVGDEDNLSLQAATARTAAAQAAAKVLEGREEPEAKRLAERYRRVAGVSGSDGVPEINGADHRSLHRETLVAQRRAVQDLVKLGTIGEEVARCVLADLDLVELLNH